MGFWLMVSGVGLLQATSKMFKIPCWMFDVFFITKGRNHENLLYTPRDCFSFHLTAD